MMVIIDGKTYNTKTATEINSYDAGLGWGDFRNYEESLYVTKKGAYFLFGKGGPMTKYSEPCGNMTGGGSRIVPMTKDEALRWLEGHDMVDQIEEYFSDMIEDA